MEIEGLYRRHYGKLVAILARIVGVGRLDVAEQIAQESFVRALQVWPFAGMPESPEAWLTTAAKNRALDWLRGERTAAQKTDELAQAVDADFAGAREERAIAYFSGEIADSQLRMVLACCHPSLPREGQIALTLKVVCGLSTGEIAAAFLTAEATIAQRIVRAKAALKAGGVALEVPAGAALAERVGTALEVLYFLFNAGYAAADGEAPIKGELAAEAIRLVELILTHERCALPQASAAAALFCFQASRFDARTDAAGELLLLADQDRKRWDRGLIARGFHHLAGAARGDELTALHLEAGIAALHAAAPSFDATDWAGIVTHYDALLARTGSPVVALNRAVAIMLRAGAGDLDDALAILKKIDKDGALAAYAPLHAALGEANRRRGALALAKTHYARAARFAKNHAERRFLAARLQQLEGTS